MLTTNFLPAPKRIASAVAGFAFVRRELSRTFLQILQSASRAASGDLEQRIRTASEDEIGKISETIRAITEKLEEQSSESVKVLKHAAGFLRHKLGKLMHIRVIPELHFFLDRSLEEGARLGALINEAIASDRKKHD